MRNKHTDVEVYRSKFFSLFTLKAFEEAAKRLKMDEEDRKKMVRAMTY